MAAIPVFADFQLDSIIDATAQQHADARAYVLRHAPDLLGAIFGDAR